MEKKYENKPLNYIQAESSRYYRAPLVRLDDTQIGNTIYENYDGANMDVHSECGGYVLRIRKLKKVYKEIEKTPKGNRVRYLYSGYIYNTVRENDLEITDLDNDAYPVCFETSVRVSDISKYKIKKIREGFLKFLSDYESFQREESIKYIGYYYMRFKEDIDGIIGECWFEKGKISSSPIIQREIEKIQKEYLERKNNPNNSDNTGSMRNTGNTADFPKYDDAR